MVARNDGLFLALQMSDDARAEDLFAISGEALYDTVMRMTAEPVSC